MHNLFLYLKKRGQCFLSLLWSVQKGSLLYMISRYYGTGPNKASLGGLINLLMSFISYNMGEAGSIKKDW